MEDRWWERPAPGEGWTVMIDPETGRVSEHWREHLWLAPLRGLAELCSDIAGGRMRTRDWVFLGVVVVLMSRGAG